MAEYKVPQDVEADDKLLGPLTFRQFIYAMIVLGMTVLTVTFFQIFPFLALIPLPIALFFTILALPIKKDQPMETYLAALVSFYFKPKKRIWMSGQSESTILITAPKVVEVKRVRDITEEEAGHRLSFLSELVDSEGYAIKSASNPMRDEFYAEAYNTTDMFDSAGSANLSHMITREQQARHEEIVNQMRSAIYEPADDLSAPTATSSAHITGEHTIQPLSAETTEEDNFTIVQPVVLEQQQMADLAENSALSVDTIQQQANRIQKNNNQSEVYVPLR